MVIVADGFLGRWSQRKLAVQEGKVLDQPPASEPKPLPGSGSSAAPDPARVALAPAPGATADGLQVGPAEQPPPLSLDDVKNLTAESDYSAFVARDVSPEVRNAAMKKLFSDPHYNVMDRLDIYIDDYSLADPLPESMLRKMASAKFLKLFEEEEPPEEQRQAHEPSAPHAATATMPLREDAGTLTPDSVAQSREPLPGPAPLLDNQPDHSGPDHDHTDLRLQPNHAAGPQEPGRRTE